MRYFLALLLLCLPAFGQSSSVSSIVPTTTEMKARVPRLGEVITAKGRKVPGDWGTDTRQFVAVVSDPASVDDVDYFVTGSTNYMWESTDRNAYVRWVTWGNVKKDGTTDDTAGIQYMVNRSDGKVLHFPRGTYRVDGTVTVTNSVRLEGSVRQSRWIGNGSATGAMVKVQSSDFEVSGITFDGQLLSHRGVEIADGVEKAVIRSCGFTNLQESANRVTVIGVDIHGDTEVTIEKCNFEDIYGYPNGVVGYTPGFAHGIYINRTPFSYPGPPKRILIHGCVFRRILPGEDSDAIRWTDSTWTYRDANVVVDSCYFEDIGKRCIKASGSGGYFVNNIFTNSFDGSIQATGWADVSGQKEQYACISLYGRNHRVIGNKFYGGRIRNFIDTTTEADNCIIGFNTFNLSTNWGLNGLSTNNTGWGTVGISCYGSDGMTIIGNTIDAVQFGIQFYSSSSNLTIVGNTLRGLGISSDDGTNRLGRGIRLGRYSDVYTNGVNNGVVISGNSILNFRGGIDLSECTNVVLGVNRMEGVEREIILNTNFTEHVDPAWQASGDTNFVTRAYENTLSGGVYGAIKLYRPLYLHSSDADAYVSTADRGQMIWDSGDKAVASYNGRNWDSYSGGTRKYTGGAFTMVWTNVQQTVTNTFPGLVSIYTNTIGTNVSTMQSWWRVAEVNPTGYGGRGSAIIRVGHGGGATADSTVFRVSINYYEPTVMVLANSPSATSAGPPLTAVRVVRDVPREKTFFEISPAFNLNSFVAVSVDPEWVTQAGMDPVFSWRASGFTNTSVLLTTNETVSLTVSNLQQKSLAFAGDDQWWFGRNSLSVGTNFLVDAPGASTETPLTLRVGGGLNRVNRDPASGALYTGTYAGATNGHTHDASNVVSGTLAVARLPVHTHDASNVVSGTLAVARLPVHSHDASNVVSGVLKGERLGTGTPSTNTYLQGGGAGASPFWGTIPSVPSPTNGIADAPADGAFYGRRNNSWTGPAVADVSGLQTELDDRQTYTSMLSDGVTAGSLTSVGDLTVYDVPLVSPGAAYTPLVQASGGFGIKRMSTNDMRTQLGAAAATHTHTESDVTGLTADLDAKLNITNVVAGTNVSVQVVGQTVVVNSTINPAAFSPLAFAVAEPKTVGEATKTETTLLGAVRVGESKTLSAGYLTSGSVLKIEMMGTFTTSLANWDGGRLKVKVGGLTLSFMPHDVGSTVPSGWTWHATCYVLVQTAGSTATYSASGQATFPDNDLYGSIFMPQHIDPSVSGTLDTTGTNVVDVTWQNTDADMGLTVTLKTCIVTKY